jgi:hypothetical protein
MQHEFHQVSDKDLTLSGGSTSTIFFADDCAFLSFSTADAHGTAAMPSGSSRDGGTTIVAPGTERYEIPDASRIGE